MTAERTLREERSPRGLRPLKETERTILDAIRRQPGRSRAQLSAELLLSPALLSGTITTFLQDGWITERRQRVSARRGQPALQLKVRTGSIAGLGISLSTGGIQVAAVDLAGSVLGWLSEPMGAQDFDAAYPILQASVGHLLDTADNWAGITIWVPALINKAGQIAEVTPTQRGVDYTGYKQTLERHFGLPVALENKCPAIDEAMYGSSPDAVIFMLFLDYGVGGSMIDKLRVFRGGFGQAVNIGALVPETGPRPSLPDLAQHLGLSRAEPGPDVLAAIAQAPDDQLADWIASRGEALSDPLSIVTQLFNPTEIVLSGIFPQSILEGLAARVDLSRFDAPGRLPIGKPQLRSARTVGPKGLAVCAGSTSLYRALSDPDS